MIPHVRLAKALARKYGKDTRDVHKDTRDVHILIEGPLPGTAARRRAHPEDDA